MPSRKYRSLGTGSMPSCQRMNAGLSPVTVCTAGYFSGSCSHLVPCKQSSKAGSYKVLRGLRCTLQGSPKKVLQELMSPSSQERLFCPASLPADARLCRLRMLGGNFQTASAGKKNCAAVPNAVELASSAAGHLDLATTATAPGVAGAPAPGRSSAGKWNSL